MKCPYCGQENRADAFACRRCTRSLAGVKSTVGVTTQVNSIFAWGLTAASVLILLAVSAFFLIYRESEQAFIAPASGAVVFSAANIATPTGIRSDWDTTPVVLVTRVPALLPPTFTPLPIVTPTIPPPIVSPTLSVTPTLKPLSLTQVPTSSVVLSPTLTITPTATPKNVTAAAPTDGKWADFNRTDGMTRLMQGSQVKYTFKSAWGIAAPDGPNDHDSTHPGTYKVYVKRGERHLDKGSGAYIEDWVGFDQDRQNGFHSFLEDVDGNVTDGHLGAVTNGSIRTAEHKTIYDWLDIGSYVIVHD